MSRPAVVVGLLVWAGAALVLSRWSRLARPSLTERLRPFHPGAEPGPTRRPRSEPVLEVIAGVARDAGDRLAAVLGASESAERRLHRIHSSLDAAAFRVRQAVTAFAAAAAGSVVSTVGHAPPAVAALLVAGGPVLAFLVVEQRLARRSEQWQEATSEELPVVAEQLAMLLNAGFSVGAALHRLAERGQGCVARDLEGVVNRTQQGLAETLALREWADRVGVDSVHRLVTVLALHSQAADLGRLVSAEARAARRDLHRRTVERIERRAQQVWVPVTVATLVPGAILLAVPFLAALHAFSNT